MFFFGSFASFTRFLTLPLNRQSLGAAKFWSALIAEV